MEPTQKYEEIISTINLDKIYHVVTKKSRLGAPEELNYAAMIISIVVSDYGQWNVPPLPFSYHQMTRNVPINASSLTRALYYKILHLKFIFDVL